MSNTRKPCLQCAALSIGIMAWGCTHEALEQPEADAGPAYILYPAAPYLPHGIETEPEGAIRARGPVTEITSNYQMPFAGRFEAAMAMPPARRPAPQWEALGTPVTLVSSAG